MKFDDDEHIGEIQVGPDNSNSNSSVFQGGRTKLSFTSKPDAPLEKTKFKVLLEVTGDIGLDKHRNGLDLVAVLDVSGSMDDDNKLDKLKTAMQFVIRKLSSIDRLSVVTFAHHAHRLCKLRKMNDVSKVEIEEHVNDLDAYGSTNMIDGLKMGLKVLSDRRIKDGRTFAIMLMSDGEQNQGGDAAQVHIGKVPVFTFGFGKDHEPKVLKDIAHNSIEGTFADIQNTHNLSTAFSQCLAGLLTTVVSDLKLIIKPDNETKSIIENVYAGTYPQVKDKAESSVEVSFGNLYDREVRKVLVHLLLPAVGDDILRVNCKYSYKEEEEETEEEVVSIRRSNNETEEVEKIILEELRIQTAEKLKEARQKADARNLEGARDIIVEAQMLLEDVAPDTYNPLIKMLMSELEHFLELLENHKTYKTHGRSFALSAETSHNRQRFAVRGHVEKTRMFSTPRMDLLKKHAQSFVDNPHKPLPTADDDHKHEVAAKRLG